ncbi:MAG: FYDLN acid domain-containing protein [Alphaproteobacteria bacterium]|nr:FYDLN acid domain-containing protein [Alphaproteobacteria bacterium]
MNLKWGKKVECPKCHKIFYDMGKQELTCPGKDCNYQFINKIDKERLDKIHESDEDIDLENDKDTEFDDNDEHNDISEEEDETLASSIKRIDSFMNTVED